MAGGFPTGWAFANAKDIGTVTTASLGTTIQNSGSTNTKQAWVELIASTPTDADWIEIAVEVASGNFATYSLVDIGVGPSGSQQVVFSNLSVVRNGSIPIAHYAFPCSIPAGSSVWVRALWDNNNTSDVMYVNAQLFQSDIGTATLGAVVDTYGVQTSTSPYTTQITLPSSDDTMSSWTSVASLSYNVMGFSLHLDFGGGNSYNGPLWFGLLNIGTGASGSQTVIVSNLQFSASSPTNGLPCIYPPVTNYYPISLPSGTNVWVQAQVVDYYASGAAPRILGVSFHGVRG